MRPISEYLGCMVTTSSVMMTVSGPLWVDANNHYDVARKYVGILIKFNPNIVQYAEDLHQELSKQS